MSTLRLANSQGHRRQRSSFSEVPPDNNHSQWLKQVTVQPTPGIRRDGEEWLSGSDNVVEVFANLLSLHTNKCNITQFTNPEYAGPFRDDLAANFAEMCKSKVAMITGNEWMDRDTEDISHHARALACEIAWATLRTVLSTHKSHPALARLGCATGRVNKFLLLAPSSHTLSFGSGVPCIIVTWIGELSEL